MRILVAIANYGFKQMECLSMLIGEYQSMPCEIDLVVLTDVHKIFNSDIEVSIGLPTKNPWSLPFGHKRIFAERMANYDLFIYSEDDILITWKNIESFLELTGVLPDGYISGFLRYEVLSNGTKWYPDFLGPYHWFPKSLKKIGRHSFAEFSNLHSACYMLTRHQLQRVISSGKYLVEPHQGRYDLLCSAATDPYTQCGLKKVICISQIDDMLVHHLSNRYAGQLGINQSDFEIQVSSMLSTEYDSKSQDDLFIPTKEINHIRWDKVYFDKADQKLLSLVPDETENVLSIGCAYPASELSLAQNKHRVTVIPMDSIVGMLASSKGIEVTEPNFINAFHKLQGTLFDCIIFSEVLQHLEEPLDILSRAVKLLAAEGVLLVSVPNFRYLKVAKDHFPYPFLKRWTYSENYLQMIDKKQILEWFRLLGVQVIDYQYVIESQKLKRIRPLSEFFSALFATRLMVKGKKYFNQITS